MVILVIRYPEAAVECELPYERGVLISIMSISSKYEMKRQGDEQVSLKIGEKRSAPEASFICKRKKASSVISGTVLGFRLSRW